MSIKKLKHSIACGLILLTAIGFFVSCEKVDPREAVLKNMSGRYCLMDIIWEGESFDFNGDGKISDLMDEIKTASGYVFVKNTLILGLNYNPGLYNSAFSVSVPIQLCNRTYDDKISSIEVNFYSTMIEYNILDSHNISYRYPEMSISYSGMEVCSQYSDASVFFNEDTAILSYDATFYDFSSGKDVAGKVSYIYVK